jgi:hypothetical protein
MNRFKTWPPNFEEGILTPGDFFHKIDESTGEVIDEEVEDDRYEVTEREIRDDIGRK